MDPVRHRIFSGLFLDFTFTFQTRYSKSKDSNLHGGDTDNKRSSNVYYQRSNKLSESENCYYGGSPARLGTPLMESNLYYGDNKIDKVHAASYEEATFVIPASSKDSKENIYYSGIDQKEKGREDNIYYSGDNRLKGDNENNYYSGVENENNYYSGINTLGHQQQQDKTKIIQQNKKVNNLCNVNSAQDKKDGHPESENHIYAHANDVFIDREEYEKPENVIPGINSADPSIYARPTSVYNPVYTTLVHGKEFQA